MGLVLAACPTAKNGVAVTRDYAASASYCMRNSFYQHNNVRRPGESHRGAERKKICGICILDHLVAVSRSVGLEDL